MLVVVAGDGGIKLAGTTTSFAGKRTSCWRELSAIIAVENGVRDDRVAPKS